ncbi:MAG TPA: SMP-30/gluconolactonase/LRE family protein [Methylomirabilota bacterium]|nr:SMP-30/gluconolactonase/LRE family protein [Methylomirabilota bacterium]
MKPFVLTLLSLIGSLSTIPAQNLAGDMALSKILIESADWEIAAQGFGFTDGLCADAACNLFFYDLGRGTAIKRLDAAGAVTDVVTNAPKCSGLKFGPDGRLYACTQGPRKQVVAIDVTTGQLTVLADDVQPNDLVVSRRGDVYFTETGKGQVTRVRSDRPPEAAAKGINKPNGISLSPDQGTLVVSEYGGPHVWAYRVERDGALSAGSPYMTLRVPPGREDSGGDGMTTDDQGRYYVTSHAGIQMFDATGRLGGVIAKPQNKATVSVAFAGPDLRYLYVASSDRIYRRKTQTRGVLFHLLEAPPGPRP